MGPPAPGKYYKVLIYNILKIGKSKMRVKFRVKCLAAKKIEISSGIEVIIS